MKSLNKIAAMLAFLPLIADAQGTFVYDQQSSDELNTTLSGNVIQNVQPTGQSFTPALDAIGFVRFNLFDQVRNNGTGAVIYVNLRSDSITGPVIDSTAPVALPDSFGLVTNGFVNFFFSGNVTLQPGTKYYLQPVVESGDLWGIFGSPLPYAGGDLYANGVAFSSDYWFREGVIVPEPCTIGLVALCMGIYACRKVRTT